MNNIAREMNQTGYQLLSQGKDWPLGGCLVSPLVLKIRDNGPAILDGECYRHDAAALLSKLPANTVQLEEGLSTNATFKEPDSSQNVDSPKAYLRMNTKMFISILVLLTSLLCVGTYAWQQKSQVSYLETELLLLKAAAED